MKHVLANFAIAFVGVLAITGGPVGAQETPNPATGHGLRIARVTESTSRTTVLLLANRTDSLLAIEREKGAINWIAFEHITKVETYAGQKSNWLRGAAIGAFAGILAGGIIGGDDFQDISAAEMVAAGAVAGCLGGAIAGAFIKTDRWSEVPREQLQATTSGLVAAQDIAKLAARDRLVIHRVTRSTSSTAVFVLASRTDSLLTIDREEGAMDWIALRDIENVEAHVGRKSNWIRGAVIGTLAGAAAGAWADDTQQDDEHDGLIFGAGTGLIVGTVTGALIKTDRWKEVPREHLQLVLNTHRPTTLGLAMTWRF